MKKSVTGLAAVVIVLAIGCGVWEWWKKDEPRRICLNVLQNLHSALNSTETGKLPQMILLPVALQSRTGAEQSEFIRKALQDEISTEGLAVLKREAQFGPLTNIFPKEAAGWAN